MRGTLAHLSNILLFRNNEIVWSVISDTTEPVVHPVSVNKELVGFFFKISNNNISNSQGLSCWGCRDFNLLDRVKTQSLSKFFSILMVIDKMFLGDRPLRIPGKLRP